MSAKFGKTEGGRILQELLGDLVADIEAKLDRGESIGDDPPPPRDDMTFDEYWDWLCEIKGYPKPKEATWEEIDNSETN